MAEKSNKSSSSKGERKGEQRERENKRRKACEQIYLAVNLINMATFGNLLIASAVAAAAYGYE